MSPTHSHRHLRHRHTNAQTNAQTHTIIFVAQIINQRLCLPHSSASLFGFPLYLSFPLFLTDPFHSYIVHSLCFPVLCSKKPIYSFSFLSIWFFSAPSLGHHEHYRLNPPPSHQRWPRRIFFFFFWCIFQPLLLSQRVRPVLRPNARILGEPAADHRPDLDKCYHIIVEASAVPPLWPHLRPLHAISGLHWWHVHDDCGAVRGVVLVWLGEYLHVVSRSWRAVDKGGEGDWVQ